jgi:hypothetical protein
MQDICISYLLSIIIVHRTLVTENLGKKLNGQKNEIFGHLALTETQQNNPSQVPLEYHVRKP